MGKTTDKPEKVEISSEFIDQLLNEVAQELGLHKAASTDLPPKSKEEKAPPVPAVSAPGEADAPQVSASGGEDDSAPPVSAPDAPADGVEDVEMQGEPSVEALQSEYEALTDDQLRSHYMAIKQAIVNRMGDGAGPDQSDAEPTMPMKKEMSASKEESTKEDSLATVGESMGKTELELEVEQLKKSLAESQAKASEHEEALKVLVTALEKPIRKGFYNMSEIKEEKQLSKAEIDAKLRELCQRPDLQKSERQLLNDYFLGRNPDLTKLTHLLK